MTPNDPSLTFAEEPGGLPAKCRPCWWREGRACFSEAFGPVPKTLRTFTDSAGVEQSYTANTGHALTDAHLQACHEKRAEKSRASVWDGFAQLVGAKVIR